MQSLQSFIRFWDEKAIRHLIDMGTRNELKIVNTNINAEPHFESEFQGAREASGSDKRAKFLEKYRPFLKNLAERYGQNDFQGRLSNSDVVQSAIIGAFEDLSACTATTEVEFKAWLKRLLLNDIMNKFRNMKRKKRDVRRDLHLGSADLLSMNADSPSEQMIAAEDRERLEAALSKLSENDQLVVRLRNHDKLKFSQIGKRINASEATTRMQWARAIRKLAKLLRD